MNNNIKPESILSPEDQVQQRGSDAIKAAGWGAIVRDLNLADAVDAAAPVEGAPTHEPVERCPKCGHAPHGSAGCLNMASDNDCACRGPVDQSPESDSPAAAGLPRPTVPVDDARAMGGHIVRQDKGVRWVTQNAVSAGIPATTPDEECDYVRLCDRAGMVSDRPVEPGLNGDEFRTDLNYLQLHNNIRAVAFRESYTGPAFPCTGSMHVTPSYVIRCTSNAHEVTNGGPAYPIEFR